MLPSSQDSFSKAPAIVAKAGRLMAYSVPSNMRFTLSTLTVGSPKTPRNRPLVHWAMMSRTSPSLLPVAFARRGTWYSAASGDLGIEAGTGAGH